MGKSKSHLPTDFTERVLDLSTNGIYIYDLIKGANIYINQQYTELAGYTLNDINSMSEQEFFSLFHPDEHETITNHMAEVIGLELGEVSEIEYRFKKADGDWMWCLSRDAVFNKCEQGNTTQFMGTFIDITSRKQAETALSQLNSKLESLIYERTAQLEKSLNTQDLLMKEIHHRVKNNLQLLSSWFNLYISKESNPKIINAINDCKNNIHTLALVYSSLYQSSNLTEIDFTDYLKTLCSHIETTMSGGRPIKINLDLQPVKISIDNTITCGLITNELITNCYKHAFPDDKAGTISINLKLNKQTLTLSIKDNGVGLSNGTNLNNTNSFGLGMVQTLVEQLDGQLRMDSTKTGLSNVLTFDLPTTQPKE